MVPRDGGRSTGRWILPGEAGDLLQKWEFPQIWWFLKIRCIFLGIPMT